MSLHLPQLFIGDIDFGVAQLKTLNLGLGDSWTDQPIAVALQYLNHQGKDSSTAAVRPPDVAILALLPCPLPPPPPPWWAGIPGVVRHDIIRKRFNLVTGLCDL